MFRTSSLDKTLGEFDFILIGFKTRLIIEFLYESLQQKDTRQKLVHSFFNLIFFICAIQSQQTFQCTLRHFDLRLMCICHMISYFIPYLLHLFSFFSITFTLFISISISFAVFSSLIFKNKILFVSAQMLHAPIYA